MAQDPKDIFTKVSDADDRARLAQDVVRLKSEFICKAQGGEEVFKIEANRLDGKARVVCTNPFNSVLPSAFPVPVIASFGVGHEKYFMTSPLTDLGGGYFVLDFTKEIFHLQRRQSYRIRIPDNYSSAYEIGKLNEDARVLTGPIFDISTGGVRLQFPHDRPALTVDDMVEGVLKLGPRESMGFKGQVRHVKFERSEGVLRQIVGVEFKGLSPVMENRLFSITMELHRELLARWS